MSWLRFLKRENWDRERAREIESYFEMETADNMARGMSAEEAVAAARRRFGNAVSVREEIYRMNTVTWLESIAQDVRHGFRLIFKNPGFAGVAILSLALGIGANTAIFQLLNAVRLRSLPIQRPGELAEIRIAGGNGGMGLNDEYGELTRPIWKEIQRHSPAFSGVLAWSKRRFGVGEGSAFQFANGIQVSGDFFRVLGVEPWRGRLINPADEHACPGRTAVVSYDWWRSRMGGIGLETEPKLRIDGQPMQIVGVVPPSFFGLAVGDRFDIALPYCEPKELARNVFDLTVMGRLRPGVTVQSASAQLQAASAGIMAATEIQGYSAQTAQTYRNFRLSAWPASSGVSNLRKQYDSSLWLLLGITGMVLLIACVNLANLMLARASAREREISVRLALGAARLRLVRQLTVESSLLAVTGAVLGIGLAQVLTRVLVSSLSAGEDSVSLSTSLDWSVLLFAAAVTGLTCVVFGILPSLRASAADPVSAMKAGGRAISGSRERFSVQRALVIAQISVSLVLLTGALLFVHSFHNLLNFDPGMREEGISVALLGFSKSNVAPGQRLAFEQRVVEEVRSAPGIIDAASTTNVPLSGGSWSHGITVGRADGLSRFTWVSPGYFSTMGTAVSGGRALNERDTASSQRVALVNQTFVRRYLNGVNPVGQTLRTWPEPNYPSTVYEIVGIVADTKYSNLRDATPPMAFAPASQFPNPEPGMALMIRSSVPPAAAIASLKRRFAANHPEMITQFRVFQTDVRGGLVRERLMAMLSGFFGALAALLGTVGLFGVMSYMTRRRNNEIGIRMALGASRATVLAMVMKEAAWLLAAGIATGTILSIATARLGESLLFELKGNDPLTLLAGACLMGVIGAAASLVPARRASRMEPMDALRCD